MKRNAASQSAPFDGWRGYFIVSRTSPPPPLFRCRPRWKICACSALADRLGGDLHAPQRKQNETTICAKEKFSDESTIIACLLMLLQHHRTRLCVCF